MIGTKSVLVQEPYNGFVGQSCNFLVLMKIEVVKFGVIYINTGVGNVVLAQSVHRVVDILKHRNIHHPGEVEEEEDEANLKTITKIAI